MTVANRNGSLKHTLFEFTKDFLNQGLDSLHQLLFNLFTVDFEHGETNVMWHLHNERLEFPEQYDHFFVVFLLNFSIAKGLHLLRELTRDKRHQLVEDFVGFKRILVAFSNNGCDPIFHVS